MFNKDQRVHEMFIYCFNVHYFEKIIQDSKSPIIESISQSLLVREEYCMLQKNIENIKD